MENRNHVLGFLSLLLALTVSCAVPSDTNAQADTVRQQIAKYTAALEAPDTYAASQVWLNSPDVSLISPAGHNHGWDEVKKFYEFFQAAFSDRKLTAHDISVHVSGDSAWAEFYWHFTAKQRSDGALIQTDGRESQVYRKVAGDHWALVHVHYSGMPAMP